MPNTNNGNWNSKVGKGNKFSQMSKGQDWKAGQQNTNRINRVVNSSKNHSNSSARQQPVAAVKLNNPSYPQQPLYPVICHTPKLYRTRQKINIFGIIFAILLILTRHSRAEPLPPDSREVIFLAGPRNLWDETVVSEWRFLSS